MNAVVISIGNELTLGQTVDTNAAWLSQRLARIGIPVIEHLAIADETESIRRELARASELADVVLVSGGLGPTADDLTRHGLAAAMGVELERRDEWIEEIRGFFTCRHRPMPDANLVQADFPVGATPIRNTCGTAPGIRAELNRATLFAMPGVPREMKTMYERDVLPALADRAGTGTLLSATVLTYGAGESDVGEKIRDLMARDQNPTVGTTADQAIIGVRICARGKNQQEAHTLLDATAGEVRRRLGSLVFGQDNDTLAVAVARLLVDRSRTVSTAESCTGGLVAKSLTDIPGSSAYFIDGVVTYSNQAKIRLLNVPADLIEQHGAVSPQVAEAMAINCRQLSNTDYALSVTGIAGPTGGSPGKPVGLVYIALADESVCEVHEHRIGQYLTREEIRDRTRKVALNLLRLRLMET